MTSNQVIEAVFELDGDGEFDGDRDTTSAAIANHIGGSVVDAITLCVELEKKGQIRDGGWGWVLTDAGMKVMEVITA